MHNIFLTLCRKHTLPTLKWESVMISMDHFDINITSIIAHLRDAYHDHLLPNSYIPQEANKRRSIILAVIYLNSNVTMFSTTVLWSDTWVLSVAIHPRMLSFWFPPTHQHSLWHRHSMPRLYWERHRCFRREIRAGGSWKYWYVVCRSS